MDSTTLLGAATDVAANYDALLSALDRLDAAREAESEKRAAARDKLRADVIINTFDMQNVPARLNTWQTEDKQFADRLDAFATMKELLNEQRAKYERDYGPQIVGILEVRMQGLQKQLDREGEEAKGLRVQIERFKELIESIKGKAPSGKVPYAGKGKT